SCEAPGNQAELDPTEFHQTVARDDRPRYEESRGRQSPFDGSVSGSHGCSSARCGSSRAGLAVGERGSVDPTASAPGERRASARARTVYGSKCTETPGAT